MYDCQTALNYSIEHLKEHIDLLSLNYEIVMFLQTWPNTSLAFNRISGQAFTSAYTVVIMTISNIYVYVNGCFAYFINRSNPKLDNFIQDLSCFNLENIQNAVRRYNAKRSVSISNN